jgi:acetylornithine/succinyldiaminopimelate/putrescine aminotransferase
VYEKRCNKCLSQYYPPDHEQVIESNDLLSALTSAAVNAAKEQRLVSPSAAEEEEVEQQRRAPQLTQPPLVGVRGRGVLPKPGARHNSKLPYFSKGRGGGGGSK